MKKIILIIGESFEWRLILRVKKTWLEYEKDNFDYGRKALNDRVNHPVKKTWLKIGSFW